MLFLLLLLPAAAQQLLDCECRDAADRILEDEGKWYVGVTSCSGAHRVGPYESREEALRDISRLEAEVDFCVDRLVGHTGDAVPHADYVALQVDLELARVEIGELEHDIAQLEADNDLLKNHLGLAEFQEHIAEYLKHATGSDDLLQDR